MTHELSRTLDVRGYRDEDGNTLLHTACVAVQEKIAEVLTLNYGLKIDELNYANQTPLVAAISRYDRTDGANYVLACKLAMQEFNSLRNSV